MLNTKEYFKQLNTTLAVMELDDEVAATCSGGARPKFYTDGDTALTAAMRYIPKSESFDTTGQGEKLYCIIAVSAVIQM